MTATRNVLIGAGFEAELQKPQFHANDTLLAILQLVFCEKWQTDSSGMESDFDSEIDFPREVIAKFKTMQMVYVRIPTTDGLGTGSALALHPA